MTDAARGEAASSSSKPILLALSAGNFTVGIAAFVVLGLMSTITRSLSLEPGEAGRLVTYYAVAYAIGSPPLIAGTGRLPRRQIVTGAMALVGLGCFGCALAPSLGWMEAARIVTAFGGGLYSPATAAIAVSLVPADRRGRALSQVFMGFTAAQGIGNPIGAWLGYTFGWQSAFLAVGAMALVMAIGLWRMIPADIAFRPTSLAELGGVLRTPHLLIALLFTVFFVSSSYTTLTFLTLILETRLGISGNGVALFLALYGAMSFVAAVTGGVVADKIGPSRALLLFCAMLFVLMPLVTQGPVKLPAMAVIVGAWSLFSWSHFTAQQSRLVAIDPSLAQLLLALNSSMLYVGIATGSALAAWLLPVAEFRGLAIGADLLLAVAVIVLLLGDRIVRWRR